MDKIIISVLLPMYNASAYVLEAVQSILNQSFTNFELIIIDDNSFDNSVTIVEQIKDKRIVLIRKETNSGISDSLNCGLKIAKGKYIARMDADDISHVERFEKQLKFLENNPDIILCGTWFELLNEDIVVRPPQTNNEIAVTLLESNAIGHPTVMFRKDIFINKNLFYDKLMEPAEDYDLWVRASRYGKLYNIPEVLLSYRVHSNQISSVRIIEQEIKLRQINKFHISLIYGNSIPSVDITIPVKEIKSLNYAFFLESYLLELKKINDLNIIHNIFDSFFFQNYCNVKKKNILNFYFLTHDKRSFKIFLKFINPYNQYFQQFSNKLKIIIILKNLNFFKW